MNDPMFPFFAANTVVAMGLCGVALVCAWARVRPAIVAVWWLAALVKLVVPSVLPVPVLPAPAATSAAEARDSVVAPPVEAVESAEPRPGLESAGQPLDGAPAAAPVPPHALSSEGRAVAGLSSWRPWLLGVWAAGAAGWAGLALTRLVRFNRLVRRGKRVIPGRPEVVAVAAPIAPLLWAFGGRACIVVPREFFESLTHDERAAVIAHERAHFRRRDHWVRWIEGAVLAVMWWHPLAWWISRRLRAAEEAACDALVVRETGDPRAYAAALLRTALFLDDGRPLLRGATGMGSADSLKQRVRFIMNAPDSRRLSRGATAVLISSTAFSVLALPVEQATPPSAVVAQADAAPESVSAVEDEILVAPAAEPSERLPDAIEPAGASDPVDHPAEDPPSESMALGQAYREGYIKFQEAEKRHRAGDFRGARAVYAEALGRLESVQRLGPEWHPRMVEYRIGMVQRALKRLGSTSDVAERTILLTSVSPVAESAGRTGVLTAWRGQPLVVVADRIDHITADPVSGQASQTTFRKGARVRSETVESSAEGLLFRAEGSVLAGWGGWRLRADSVRIQGSTLVFAGSRMVLVNVNQDPPQQIFDGDRIVMNERDNTLRVSGASRFLMGQVVHKNNLGTMDLRLSLDDDVSGFRISGGVLTILNSSAAEGETERRRLLQGWPDPSEWEAEFGPLLRPGGEAPWPSVDGSRGEGSPKNDGPPK